MATYFIRETEAGKCTGCGVCVEVCPVEALIMKDEIAVIEADWCIGCGVCIGKCSSQAARIVIRPDKRDEKPAINFQKLHETILEEKGLK